MARAIALIRNAAMGTRHPEHLLERINEQLCARNAANIFVTMFCAFLDVVSGRLVYANGGHCPPFLAHEGRASSLPMPKGALVGIMPGAGYAANEVGLDQGVALVCYTDGVTEAESAAGHAFSEERLLRIGAANCRQYVEDLLRPVQRELAPCLMAAAAGGCTLVVVRRPIDGIELPRSLLMKARRSIIKRPRSTKGARVNGRCLGRGPRPVLAGQRPSSLNASGSIDERRISTRSGRSCRCNRCGPLAAGI